MSTTRPDAALRPAATGRLAASRRASSCAGRVPAATRRRGFALPSAIFLLVVLASLGAFIVSISSTQQQTQVQDVEGVRAYWAARAAAEYGLALALAPEDTGGAAVFAACPAGVPGGVIDGFTIAFACERSPAAGHHVESGVNLVVYAISATASRGAPGALGYVERQVSVKAAKCKDPNAVLPGGVADPRLRCG